ncbi:probable G-protein coupled receptor Mth-like 10 [Halyomorpha halys]|uniref:probable G-protein coupled receptor Mth-like 10 n=1 Tax=Halyomorpha halys TaxID=286706 RepID=UPI0034D18E08
MHHPLLLLLAVLPLSLAQKVLLECPSGELCVRKCCPEGHKIGPGACIPGGEGIDVPNGTLVVFDRPECPMYYLEPGSDVYQIHYNGTLVHLSTDAEIVTREFCLEENEFNETYTYVCFPPNEEEVLEATLQAYSIGLFFSLPFLLATVIVYASFKRLRNLHGKCVLYHTSSMLVAYLLLALAQNGHLQEETPCFIVGYAIQFFFMATFFWLNVMCFDIYWAFSGLRNLTGSVKERERKKLIVYSIYAWCTPLLILVITVAVDLSPSIPVTSFFKPRVGEDKCFFKEKGATWIYFYLPMALIILSNIILFGVTAYRIWSHRREAAVLKRGDSRKHDSTNDKESLFILEGHEEQHYLPWYSDPKTSTDKYLFTLYLKLFIVMGINWVMELLSSIAEGAPNYLWYIPDFTNTLQGLFIFLIFVWKKRVRRLVWAKILSCWGKKPISSNPRNTWSGSSRNTNSTNSTHTVNNSIKMNPATQASQTTLA